MKKLNLLSKAEMKNVIGGVVAGSCYECIDSDGHASCWYTNNPSNLCNRVYPNAEVVIGLPLNSCDGCTMN